MKKHNCISHDKLIKGLWGEKSFNNGAAVEPNYITYCIKCKLVAMIITDDKEQEKPEFCTFCKNEIEDWYCHYSVNSLNEQLVERNFDNANKRYFNYIDWDFPEDFLDELEKIKNPIISQWLHDLNARFEDNYPGDDPIYKRWGAATVSVHAVYCPDCDAEIVIIPKEIPNNKPKYCPFCKSEFDKELLIKETNKLTEKFMHDVFIRIGS